MKENRMMSRSIIAAALVLAGAMPAMAANDTIRLAWLPDRLKDRPQSPIIGVDLMCGRNEKQCMQGAESHGKGWTCRYVPEWQQWCLFPPGH
jgi:hypothetical protein